MLGSGSQLAGIARRPARSSLGSLGSGIGSGMESGCASRARSGSGSGGMGCRSGSESGSIGCGSCSGSIESGYRLQEVPGTRLRQSAPASACQSGATRQSTNKSLAPAAKRAAPPTAAPSFSRQPKGAHPPVCPAPSPEIPIPPVSLQGVGQRQPSGGSDGSGDSTDAGSLPPLRFFFLVTYLLKSAYVF
ncbi:hypothetical protein T492DRAFT_14114 [Pavlovales sp. CCMP2436]|nr:hypothetical protein T492DRAFT_14114 [Pavlovales sp. CCMP2436]